MNINRRMLMLPALAVALLGVVPGSVVPAFAGADEDAIAKNLEAFRAPKRLAKPRIPSHFARKNSATATPTAPSAAFSHWRCRGAGTNNSHRDC